MFLFQPAPVPLRPSYALSLTHPGDGLKIPNTPVLDPAGDLTLEAWIKPVTADNGGNFHFIVSKNYGGTGYALLLIGHGDDVRLQFEARDVVAYPIKMHVFANHWWHVAGVFHSHKDLTLYVNGVQVAQKQTNLEMQPNELPVYIGTSQWDSFGGDVGDVRIWSAARTQEQILDGMTQHPAPSTPDLIGNWTFKILSRGRSYDLTHHTRPALVLGHPTRVANRGRKSASL